MSIFKFFAVVVLCTSLFTGCAIEAESGTSLGEASIADGYVNFDGEFAQIPDGFERFELYDGEFSEDVEVADPCLCEDQACVTEWVTEVYGCGSCATLICDGHRAGACGSCEVQPHKPEPLDAELSN